MSRLLIFNPEHDYALADAHKHYYPPAGVIRLRRRFQYLPAISARDGDLWLYEGICYDASTLRAVPLEEAMARIDEIRPWGWDLAIRAILLQMGFSPSIMPSDFDINQIRRISHRRIAIECNVFLNSPHVPVEHFSLEDAMLCHQLDSACCFKAPWSSSGRGVMFCKGLAVHAVSEWIHGVVKKQGSVMSETVAERVLDFASLWNIRDTEVMFRGFSVSITDPRGRYRGNLLGPQEDLIRCIRDKAPDFDGTIINAQHKFLVEKIAPFYSGPLGIDMLVESGGEIRPCIEINLRNTMGHVAMDLHEALISERKNYVEKVIKKIPPVFIPSV